jgi:hypothetical protein
VHKNVGYSWEYRGIPLDPPIVIYFGKGSPVQKKIHLMFSIL